MKFSLGLACAAATSALAGWGPPSHGQHGSHGHHDIQWHGHQWKPGFHHSVDPNHRKGRQGCQKMPEVGDHNPAPTKGNATFTQLIDHRNPHLGTFEQLFFWNTEFWKGPGSPIVLFTPGEVNASAYGGYLTNRTTPGSIAQKVGGAAVMIEHRYWGYSSPYADLTNDKLQYLTLDNAIADLTNFAKNVKLPFAKHGHSNAGDVPWVMSGGSYSGALSAWTESTAPNVFWAYHASSAPVQAISDFWEYFIPIENNMPKNCSSDISAVTAYMDNILEHGTKEEVVHLKTQFGLEGLSDNADFMAVLWLAVELWQSNQLFTGYSDFYVMCDAIEGVYTKGAAPPTAKGSGVELALPRWASWFKTMYIPHYCENFGPYEEWKGENNTKCLDMKDPTNPVYTDHTVSNVLDRQWVWMTCNEPFGYWQTGEPAGRGKPNLISRLLTPDYFIEQCSRFFPDEQDGATFGIKKGMTEAQLNRHTKGWDTRPSHRLVYGNGNSDPWREGSVSASTRPGGPLKSTPQVPVHVIPNGFHTSDMLIKNAEVNDGAKQVINAIIDQMATWIGEFPRRGHHHWRA